MSNNDVLKSLRFTFNFNDDKMMALFCLGGYTATRAEISSWLKKEDDPDYALLNDKNLATFLNGWIANNRGVKEGAQPVAEKKLNNNIILRKIKIALALIDEDILALLKLADMEVSKHELSAFFRKPEHPHFRQCKDQYIRNLLKGLRIKHRPDVVE